MTQAPTATTDREQSEAVRLLREMLRIRVTEETLAETYKEQEMRTPTHFAIGQEAIAVGVSSALRRDDVALSGHRCHAHYLAKGGDLFAMVAELYGREAGCAGGRGGSVHLNDPEAGLLASSAILGETMAVATGCAWAYKMDRLDRVAVAYFGDGVVEEGIFHETLNFAVVQRVPVLFVCENNGYSTHTPLPVRQPAGIGIAQRAAIYGLPARLVDGNDVAAVATAARLAVDWLRAGHGPYFLECTTYRWREHVGPNWDYDAGYRSRAEVDTWIERDPVARAAARLVMEGACTDADLARWRQEYRSDIETAIVRAKGSPFPSVDRLLDGTY